MARSVRDRARTTAGIRAALYSWYVMTVLATGAAGGFVFGDYWGMPLLGGGGFDWMEFVVSALAGAVIGLPVMLFFFLGERILHEVRGINDAAAGVADAKGKTQLLEPDEVVNE